MKKLVITYEGNIRTVTVEVETPMEISCEAEHNVHTVFEMADAIAELQFGQDFFEKFDIQNVSMDFAK